MTQPFPTISELIWKTRYRHANEPGIEASWQRVARALASVEDQERSQWEQKFLNTLKGLHFLPGGRILAGAGTGHEVTLCNCFVMGRIEDDMESIFNALKEGALTMQQGGGVGYDFSTLRPAGTGAARIGGIASGPVSFMHIWDSMCATLLSTTNRRGAMMGTLRCDHPDIISFVEAKHQTGELQNFNLSVLVSDDFMRAVEADAGWPLLFPASGLTADDSRLYPDRLTRVWSGNKQPVECAVMARIAARRLWREIMHANYDTAEPGVLFIDRIAQENNLDYREQISATNPCGEIPLPAYGACDLGSINLPAFVLDPFSDRARLDFQGMREVTAIATRMLDNVIDLTHYPLPRQREQAQGSRRIGLGITGLADALILLRLDYRGEAATELAAGVMRTICHTAYRTSISLAREKGGFPFLLTRPYLTSPFIQRLPVDIRQDIDRHGIRNSHLLAIAPTGAISLLADNLSSGIEPVFDFNYRRLVKDPRGNTEWYRLTDLALRYWRERYANTELPEFFVKASDLTPDEHLAMQAAVQPYVDNAVSKTVNVPQAFSFDTFQSVFEKAWKLGLKGCTTFRPNPHTGAILSTDSPGDAKCCKVN
ncbi:MAG: adenosylcobalamin-dependent ribonucleoside-diphosphate reductase [Pseudomonadota bacterium]